MTVYVVEVKTPYLSSLSEGIVEIFWVGASSARNAEAILREKRKLPVEDDGVEVRVPGRLSDAAAAATGVDDGECKSAI